MKIIIRFLIAFCLAVFLAFTLVACDDKGDADGDAVDGNDPNVCYVTFQYNDGSGRTAKASIPAGESIAAYAPNVISDCSEVVGWSLTQGGDPLEVATPGKFTLHAIWHAYEQVNYTVPTLPAEVNDRFAKLTLTGEGAKVLYIGAGVRCMTIVSEQNATRSDFSIVVRERTENIDLVFNNVNYTSKSSCSMLAQGAEYTVFLTVQGTNSIQNTGTNKTGERGGDCVHAPNLEIKGEGSLTLTGGRGKSGESAGKAEEGYSGQGGGRGLIGGVGIVANRVTVSGAKLTVSGGAGGHGGNGGDGYNSGGLSGGKHRDGGSGGSGGAGGAAMDILSFYATNDATVEIKGGAGGSGGSGGTDGAANAIFAGYGGSGGYGGNGGNALASPIADIEIDDAKVTFTAGAGGSGGSGGTSHSASKYGAAGSSGEDGVTNVPKKLEK